MIRPKNHFFKLLFIITIFLVSCASPDDTKLVEEIDQEKSELKVPLSFSEITEAAHEKEKFSAHDIIQFDLLLYFGGNERLNGTFTLSTNSENGIIAEKNGAKLYYLKDKVYVQNEDSLQTEKLRFKAYTWSYFFLFPYKLTDPGTIWANYENKQLNETGFDVEKLSFSAGTGDAPDDWYIVYVDKTTHLINTAAYIVTFSKSKEQAEEDPHAIAYGNYKNINGIPIAHNWSFWGWKDGVLTEQLGEATLSNVKFLNSTDVDFTPPADFIKI